MHLKTTLINLCLFLSVNAFCQFNNTWISTYYMSSLEEDAYKYDVGNDMIWKIENDTIIIFQFERNSSYGKAEVSAKLRADTAKLKIEGSNFILTRPESIDTISYTLSNEELTVFNVGRGKKMGFEKLPQFGQAVNSSKFEHFLTNKIFKEPYEGRSVAFMEDHTLVFSDIKSYGRHIPYWTIEKIENEAFLVLAGIEISLCQIKEFNEERFNLLFCYYEEAGFKDLEFDTIETVIRYRKENLIGKWERKIEKDEYLLLEPVSDSLEYDHKELIVFNDSTFISNYTSISKTTKWNLQLNNEIILFLEPLEDVRERQWNIKSITGDKLIVERMRRKRGASDSYFEVVEFTRSE